ncbi:phosphotransferase [Acidothermaceae bacterium B102]|nr:phosphotransferase [Acidothermaceae bacterium B102]
MIDDHARLAELISEWLPQQRWFGGKGRAITALQVEDDIPLLEGDPALHQVIVGVSYAEGEGEHYQLLVGLRVEGHERFEHARIGWLDNRSVFDAVYDPELTGVLLSAIAQGRTVGDLRFLASGSAPIDTTIHSRLLTNEQSNSSLVFGDSYILKLFRRVQPGLNPDLELTTALAAADSPHIAKPVGWIEGSLDGQPSTLALMQEFLAFGTEGWALALNSVRDLFAEGDLHADEVGGDFAAEAERLGQATAEVHQDLARVLPTRTVGHDELAAIGATMHARLDYACAVAPELAPHATAIAAIFDRLATDVGSTRLQRVHGDLHLGQVMRTDFGWVLLDFEGEPAKSLAERRELSSPVRDVAGMLRSFDYAARHLLAERPTEAQLDYRALEWAERNREAFCDGYVKGGGTDPRSEAALLRAYELDKAVYEVVYESRNRPTWVTIPLSTIEKLAG